MILPFFENTAKTIQYIAYWIVFAVLQTVAFSFIIDVPLWIQVTESLFNTFIFGALGILLWAVINYGKYSTLPTFQIIINYVALGILCIGVWIAAGYSFLFLTFGDELTSQYDSLQPLKVVIGLLVYIILIQQFILMPTSDKKPLIEDERTESDVIENNEISVTQKNTEREVLERVAVKSGSKIHVILIPEIIFLQSDGDYVQIFTSNGKYLKEQTMKYFEDHLPESLFVRVHRSYIVNIEMISRIELYEKQNQLLTLKNGQQIKTSPSGYKTLRTVLNL